MPRSDRGRPWLRSLVAGVAVTGIAFTAMTVTAPAATAEDASAVTVTAQNQDPHASEAPFPNLALTVSQTRGLVSQAVTVSWTGAKVSTLPNSQSGGENYLQLMQCWGDDPAGGPDRTTCQFGGFNTPSASRDNYRETVEEIAESDLPYSYLGSGFTDQSYTGIPFRSITGDSVESVVDGKRVPGVNLNTNQFFTQYTSNEVPWAGSGQDGSGSSVFEVQTATQAPGLGCGLAATAADGTISGQSCWLVAVPRGPGINTSSALFADNWEHRLAVKLDFRPVGVHCAIGAAERQLSGTEVAADAVSSWQPALCNADGGDAYTLLQTTDTDAAVAANSVADSPLALTTTAMSAGEGATDALAYAPIALTGVTVAFSIDRFPASGASPAAQRRARVPFDSMKLTPRLVAKLLTASYQDALPTGADKAHLGSNPRNILFDPDFRAINDPEWAEQAIISPGVSDMLLPQGRSGYAEALWGYVVADADARAFLAGTKDEWGMTVNPYFSTDPVTNESGAALDLPREDFPKADPSEVNPGRPEAVNVVTWRPFTNDLATSAYLTLRGDSLALGDWNPNSSPQKYDRQPRRLVGDRAVLSLTDTAAASRYQTVTAALRNPAGEYVAPSSESILAAAAAMTPVEGQSQVREFAFDSNEAKAAPTAYPLSLPVYAATNPALGAEELRKSYATFILYASLYGQIPGVEQGELPHGYAPLPEGWQAQAANAAVAIAQGGWPRTNPSDPSPGAPGAPTSASGWGSDGTPAAAANAAAAAAAPNPAASGAVAGALSGGKTASDPEVGGVAAAVPLSIAAGALSAIAVPFVGRFRRPDAL